MCYCDEQSKFEELRKFIQEKRNDKGALMPVLQKAQEIFGCLSYDIQEFISKELKVPMAEVYGVSTFYSQFTLEPKGEHIIRVCLGTACYVKGAQAILDRLSKELNVEVGKTTQDGKFTLEATRCLGACGLAPVMMIGEKVYGRLIPDDIPNILKEYQK
ncbi:NADP-reducing hydrogenase subunit HndA [Caloramator fervidus]|uniref:NADP-reducing hydrogenase subunit HndA n=1 Tax=Caloramator fervidus TaxID=29344 RepID=A0A1H5TV09_9CLOT|nr:NADH-quinone oxidoreductase subunit NuoE [Caloramator fervidus]SEF66626.1 NADP-reducing hydrogenase subunit HndA [Caloramator fervidus]